MSYISIIIGVWILSFFWALYWWIKYRKDKKSIESNSDLPKALANNRKAELYKNLVTEHLGGLTVVTWITVSTAIFSSMLTSWNYLHSVEIEKTDRRPWLTINQPNIVWTERAQKGQKDNPLLITANLENIGKTPASYDATIISTGSYDKIFLNPEEIPSGILFPGQSKRISWFAQWNPDDPALAEWARVIRGPEVLCVLCGVHLRVDYHLLGEKENTNFTEMDMTWTSKKEGYIGQVEASFETTAAN